MELDFRILQQVFLVESEEQLCEMEEGLIALESRPADEELLQTVFRLAHTVKGAASCCGLQSVTEFAHVLEDVIEDMRDRRVRAGGDLITLLLQSVDALRQLISDAVAGLEEIPPAHRALMKRLASRLSTADEGATDQAASESSAAGALPARARAGTLRVDVVKLDRMLNLTGEITIASGQLRERLGRLGAREAAELVELFDELSRPYAELREMVMGIRMVPVGPVFRQYVRTVRDLAKAQGKAARLAIEGAEVEVDTSVVEHIRDPITHMIRNAVDHGIEPPAAREAAGKDPCGCLTLRAYHEAGSIVIELADDGAGLDRERIIDRARARGIIGATQALTDNEIHHLIFEPGFSTAESVTDISGRGVGMDVVRRNVESLRGSVAIESRSGEGTTLTLRLPLTLAIIDGLVVSVAGEHYVVPMESVIECLELPEQGRGRRGPGVINFRGDAVPYLRARDLFDLGGVAAREFLIVVKYEGGLAGLVVDALIGEAEVVIKPMGRLFEGVKGISGSTILGGGEMALIVDVPGLLRKALNQEVTMIGKQ